MHRRQFLTTCGAAGLLTLPAFFEAQAQDTETQWFDVRDWGVEGKGWNDTAKYFDRLPAKAEGVVRAPVWSLSRHSAGMLVRFRTNATTILIDHEVTSPNLAMPHMPATGVSGLDLYAEDEEGAWRWVSVSRPTAKRMETKLIEGLIPGTRNYTVYLPLYNGTEHLKIGVPAGAEFEPILPRTEKPILFYGTSITHGACASRPGMPHPAILGRRLNRPVINLGFSGNGRMEPEVASLLAELDPAVYVIDCLPNMQGPEVTERAEPLVRTLREARPGTPIVLVEDRTYPNAPFIKSRQERHAGSREAFKAAYQNLQSAGFDKLYYVEGETLLGADRDDTTDGSHPSDLGFFRQADALEPFLRKALS
ncbi:MAG: SGNH/GDSL hydrolase family protein [Planctomycetaceae bacterium]